MANQKVTDLPEFFTEYSSDPYDQNTYEVHLKDGRIMSFAIYEDMRNFWFAYCRRDVLSHVVIVDKVQTPVKKGF
jgi:hypothetical protein